MDVMIISAPDKTGIWDQHQLMKWLVNGHLQMALLLLDIRTQKTGSTGGMSEA